MKEKTVRDWLNELPEPIRTRAVKNDDGDFTNEITATLEDALSLFCDWSKTIEDTGYWVLVSDGRYSEACAILGETLQTEQTEPEQENELLQSVKDKLAIEEYGAIGWFMLNTTQEASLVDKVAIRYAELVNNQNNKQHE